jgi:hypothetical protein
MKDNEIKIGDWVSVKKVGMNGLFIVESIGGSKYTVTQKEGTWTCRLTLKINEIEKA